ncbi:MAG TPA: hypothetical protein DF383_03990, partial [Deltaproteobacteria bacterium]|nr:hypothetical protein [Deltaproteobacteria bacterium]
MYKAFGFSDNIFNVRPLRPIQEDAKKFVGRRTDLNSFMVDIASEDKAVAVVTGHRGIGKTSFVNIMEYAASLEQPIFDGLSIHESRILPCFHKIQIEPGETVKNLLFKAISSLLFSVKEFCFETQKLFPADLEDLLSWVSEVVPTTGRALGLTAGPVGGSRGTNRDYRSFADISSTTLCEEIKKIIGKIREHLEMKGAFLNLNNLEIIEEEEFIGLMNQLRDYLFEIDGLWVILIGYPGMYSTLAMKAARVSEIISGQETFLAPLTEDEVLRILEIRRKTYRMDPDHPPPPLPLEENFIRAIYRNSDGEIRSVFKACDDIARAVFKENPTIQGIKEGIGRV